MIPAKPRSYGKVKLPSREDALRRLEDFPPSYRSLRAHALMTRDVSLEIARQLKENGVQVNEEMLQVAHPVRARVKMVMEAFNAASKRGAIDERDPLKLRAHAARALGKIVGKASPALGEMVSKYYALDNPAILKGLKAEDFPFLAAGYLTRGERKAGGSYSHAVVSSREALEILKKEQPGHDALLEGEYRECVLPLLQWLENNGVDFKKIRLQANKRIRRGDYY